MEEATRRNNLLIFLLIIIACVAGLFLVENFKSDASIKEKELKFQALKDTLDEVPVLARAVSVYDLEEGKELYGKNSRSALPLASLVKTMTVITAMSGQDKGGFVYISPQAVKQFGDYGLFAHEKWTKGDLVRFTLLTSANDGAYSLAESAEDFLGKMNLKAKKIGLEHGLFLNSTGLDIKDNEAESIANPGGYASALDANLMAVYALRAYPDLVKASIESEIDLRSESGFDHNFKNTNLFLDKIPNLLFSKTGFTDLAGGNLTVIFETATGKKIAITVLGSTMEGRFIDVEKLVNVLYGID